MAKQEVGLKIDVDVQSVGNMKQELRKATQELIAMNEKFGSTSNEAIQAAKRVANLKDAIGDAKSLTDAFNPDARFKAFGQTLGAVAGGFSAVQGAMALVGSESEDVQKSLLKVQSALAIAQGVEQMGDFAQSFKNLKAVAIDAFKGIKAAIGSTGIGLLVVALGTIVAYWDEIKGAISGVSAEQKKLNAESEKNLKTQQEKLDAIGAHDNILKLQGKSEKDILKLKIQQTDETIKAAEANLKNSIATTKAQIEASQRNKDILQGILTFLTSPIAALLKGIDLIGNAVGKNFDLYNKFYGGISSFVFDPAKVKSEGDAAIKEQEKALTELKNQRAGFQIAVNDIDKKAGEERRKKAKEAADKLAEDEKKRQEERLKQKEEDRKAEALANQFMLDQIAQQDKSDADRRKQIEDEVKASEQRQFDFQVKAAELRQKLREEELKNAEEVEKSKQQLYADTANALGILGDLIGRETAAGKALAIAQATINTWLGVTEVLKQKSVLPEPAATISKIVNVTTIVASGINAVRNIVKTNVPGGGAGGGISTSAPIAPALAPQVQATQVNTEMVNQLGNRAARAYVLNSDIQNEQQRNAYINRNASIGTP